jgi:ABC-type nitrate/sulfonate/bicarbonate transport system substrate-binding protein
MGGLQTGIALERDGDGRVLTTMDRLVPHFLAHVMFATDDTISHHPDALRRFIAGWFATLGYMEAHPQETATAVEAAWKVPAPVTTENERRVMPAMSRDGKFDPVALDLVEQSLVELGILPKRPDLAPFIDARFLP